MLVIKDYFFENSIPKSLLLPNMVQTAFMYVDHTFYQNVTIAEK